MDVKTAQDKYDAALVLWKGAHQKRLNANYHLYSCLENAERDLWQAKEEAKPRRHETQCIDHSAGRKPDGKARRGW